MGQQQLLLLTLGVIVVGMAVVVGIYAYGEKSRQSAADQLVSRNVDIATRAIVWRSKSEPFNGGDSGYDGASLERIGVEAEIIGGQSSVVTAGGPDLEIASVSTRYPQVGACTTVEGGEIVSTEVRYDGSIDLASCP